MRRMIAILRLSMTVCDGTRGQIHLHYPYPGKVCQHFTIEGRLPSVVTLIIHNTDITQLTGFIHTHVNLKWL